MTPAHFDWPKLPADIALLIMDFVKAMADEPHMVWTVYIAPWTPRLTMNGQFAPLMDYLPYERNSFGPIVDAACTCIRYVRQYHCGHIASTEEVHCPECVLASIDNLNHQCTIVHEVPKSHLHREFCDACDETYPQEIDDSDLEGDDDEELIARAPEEYFDMDFEGFDDEVEGVVDEVESSDDDEIMRFGVAA